MRRYFRVLAAAGGTLIALFAAGPTFAQKQGGILKLSHFDSPASLSILEESTRAALQPAMGIFNNLVMYKQDVPQTSMQTIIPDLATGWSWNEEGTELTFPLRQGVKWHDGKPFTAKDVKCTWDLLAGTASEKLRLNPRKSWYVVVGKRPGTAPQSCDPKFMDTRATAAPIPNVRFRHSTIRRPGARRPPPREDPAQARDALAGGKASIYALCAEPVAAGRRRSGASLPTGR